MILNFIDGYTKMVDELVEFSEYDPELKECIKSLDEIAQKERISFYEVIFEALLNDESKKNRINEKAKDWLRGKND